MILRGIRFPNVFSASGARGFFGEGYWYHNYLSRIGLDYKNCGFIAKTTTLLPSAGNMPLGSNFEPQELFPQSIRVKPFKGAVLNSVGLSGPGAQALLHTGRWQARTDPFLISFSPKSSTSEERILEVKRFVDILEKELPTFKGQVGLELNLSCPNIGLAIDSLYRESRAYLRVLTWLGIPVILKVNALFPVGVALDLSEDMACDALSVSNSLPWRDIPDKIRVDLFGTTVSPLHHLGGGGLSGAQYLLDLTALWIREARFIGMVKPILGGGGVLDVSDAERLLDVGATSVELGSVSILRPWRVQSIIQYVATRTCDA